MLRTWRRPPTLFSNFNTLQFASVTGIVVFVILLTFMTIPVVDGGVSVDFPRVRHALPMPGALREDAMQIWVTRDGKMYFGSAQVSSDSLPQTIHECLKDRDIERKVYIKADSRARWGTVKLALDGVRSAGILRVAFLAW